MNDNKASFIVEGEASESDEEDFMRPTGKQLESISLNDTVHSSDDELSIALSAFESKAEEIKLAEKPQFNTLLHKRLKESNFKLREDIKYFVQSSLKYSSDQLNEINQSLLAAQIETQESVAHRRRSSAAIAKMDAVLSSLLSYKIL